MKKNLMPRNGMMPWVMWTLVSSFFMYQFVMRLAPGLLFKEIMVKFGVSATDFGVLSSMYYFGYAGMQIPIALLLDRYGPRFVVSFCIFICSLSRMERRFQAHRVLFIIETINPSIYRFKKLINFL